MTEFLTLADEFRFKSLLCAWMASKGGRGFWGETIKETEKRGGIVKHFSEALRFCLLRSQENRPGGPCSHVCSRQEGARYHRPSAPGQHFSWRFSSGTQRRP